MKGAEEESEEQQAPAVMLAEPSFYQKDVERYVKRFAPSIEAKKVQVTRDDKIYKTSTSQFASNYMVTPQSANPYKKRSCSALSNPKRCSQRDCKATLSTVDFDHYGNTQVIAHLLKKRAGFHTSQLKFESGLRQYAQKGKFVPSSPFVYRGSEPVGDALSDAPSMRFKNSKSRLCKQGKEEDGSMNADLLSKTYLSKATIETQ